MLKRIKNTHVKIRFIRVIKSHLVERHYSNFSRHVFVMIYSLA